MMREWLNAALSRDVLYPYTAKRSVGVYGHSLIINPSLEYVRKYIHWLIGIGSVKIKPSLVIT